MRFFRCVGLFSLLALFFNSCDSNESKLRKLPVLKEKNELVLHLDNETSFFSFSTFFDREKKQISIYNDNTFSIDFYTTQTGQLLKRLVLSENDTSGIGPKGLTKISHTVINDNEIAVFNKNNETLFIIDSVGRVQKKIEVIPEASNQSGILSIPDPFLVRPLIYTDSCIYITGQLINNEIVDEREVKNVIKVNLNTGEVTWGFNRPDLFNQGNWGTNGNMYILSSDFNKEKQVFYFGYAAEDSIYIVNGDLSNIRKVSFKSSAISNVEPYGRRNSYADANSSVKYDYTTSQYQKIIYDPYRRYIYRLTYQGLRDDQYAIGGEELINGRQETIIVMTEDFEVIGEYLLPKKIYFTPMCFVDENGLYFAKRLDYMEDDRYLRFGQFQIPD